MLRRSDQYRWPLVVVLGLLVGGCASMDEDECRIADWRTIGYEDGVNGRSASHIGERREACAEYGVRPDLAAYREGREEGLREYCSPASGYRLGRGGGSPTAVCPADLAGDFGDAYKTGREIHQAATIVKRTRSKLNRKKRDLENVRSSLTQKTSDLIAPSTETERRVELLVEIQDLTSRKRSLEAEIKRLSADLDRHREKLAALEHSSIY